MIPVILLKNGDELLNKIDFKIDFNYSILVLIVALSFPVVYFFLDLSSKKRINFISILGFINVLLTGGIGVFGAMYGLSRLWFILKEGLMPLVIGVIVLLSIKRGNPLIRTFIYNEAIFKTDIINQNLEKTDQLEAFDIMLARSSYLIVLAFFFSSIIQFILAGVIVTVDPGHPDFNDQVGTMTWVSYFVVMIPSLSMFGLSLWKLVSGIKDLTDLESKEFLKN
ncbi:MAG: MFS transporter [Candidatus Marinimicrobia bacterium]|nr:MFS transporter [Candidatus Neomarinimicrobiota bacterium]